MHINIGEQEFPEINKCEGSSETRYYCRKCGNLLYHHGNYGNGPWPSNEKLERLLGPDRKCCADFGLPHHKNISRPVMALQENGEHSDHGSSVYWTRNIGPEHCRKGCPACDIIFG